MPMLVTVLCDDGACAVGVAAGAKHTLVAGMDGALWGFSSLNAIGAWSDPFVKQMRDSENGRVETNNDEIVGDAEQYDLSHDEEHLHDCFRFLFPHGRDTISMPVRIPADIARPSLQGGAAFLC
jgi:alpha-tubulin suppressor-like RCC1 family protein